MQYVREEEMFSFVSKCEKLLILFYILFLCVRTLTCNCLKQHKLYQGYRAVMFNTVERIPATGERKCDFFKATISVTA